ncbi:MAG: glycosyltransferase [Nocardioides sp.]|nr:glycosyltransferase [Nocardioides sp.]
MWHELVTMSDAELASLRSPDNLKIEVMESLLEPDGSPAVYRKNSKGDILQVDYFRDDGTRAISNRSDVRREGTLGGRLITVFGRDGTPLAQWASLRRLYHAWVDVVIGGGEAILVVDSAPAGGLFFDYRRDNVTTIQVIHNHHLLQMRAEERGKLSADVMNMLTHLDWFDAVAVLTQGQYADLMGANVLGGNGFVAPNMLVDPQPEGASVRDPLHGVIVARQVRQKRLDHALQALAGAAGAGSRAHLEMYGSGGLGPKLHRAADELSVDDRVFWRGYDPRAKEKFAEASFTILSSRYEGHPVALLEAMSAGCIPLAYDVEYGPRDTITDGVNGFLVPDGDVPALSAAIDRVASMDSAELAKMRRAAILRSQDFSPKEITQLWASALKDVRKNKRPVVNESGTVSLTGATMGEDGLRLNIDVTGKIVSSTRSVLIAWIGRNQDAYGRVKARITRKRGRLHAEAVIDVNRLESLNTGTVMDVYADICNDSTPLRKRIPTGSVHIPGVDHGFMPFATVAGNLSIHYVAAPESTEVRSV